MSEIKVSVWLGCHASYNDGMLLDKQYHLEDTIDLDNALIDFEKHVLKTVRKDKSKEYNDTYHPDTYAEELYAADTEVYIDSEYVDINNGESICGIRDFLEVMEENFSHPIGLLLAVAKNNGDDLEKLKELDDNIMSFEVDSKSNADLSHAYTEMTGMLDGDHNETLVNYFDHDSFGRDLKMDYTIYDIDNKYYAVSTQ